ncbi:MAG: hypothetical protein QNI84_07660 [Henriciella sp.]|nr:hypothetical protein [Henriciella sp.]
MVQFKQVRLPVLCAAMSLLGACFVSEAPLIPAGEAVLPLDYALTLCPDGPDSCFAMRVEGDGYATSPDYDEGDPGTARFVPLMQVEGRQIFVLEAHDLNDDAYTYLVARRRGTDAPGDADLDLALVSCGDLSEAQRSEFVAAGGTIQGGWGSECIAPDLATLTDTLRFVYEPQFSDEVWWAAGGAD